MAFRYVLFNLEEQYLELMPCLWKVVETWFGLINQLYKLNNFIIMKYAAYGKNNKLQETQ